MGTVWRVLADVIVAFIVVMFIRLVFDYVQLFAREWRPRGVVLIALETCYSLTDPPLKFVHRLPAPTARRRIQCRLDCGLDRRHRHRLHSVIRSGFPIVCPARTQRFPEVTRCR